MSLYETMPCYCFHYKNLIFLDRTSGTNLLQRKIDGSESTKNLFHVQNISLFYTLKSLLLQTHQLFLQHKRFIKKLLLFLPSLGTPCNQFPFIPTPRRELSCAETSAEGEVETDSFFCPAVSDVTPMSRNHCSAD